MKHRKIDPDSKMAAVLEGLRGESSIADICREYRSAGVCTIADGTSAWKAEARP